MEKAKIFGLIIGICAILSAVFGWWGVIAPGIVYGTGLMSISFFVGFLGTTGVVILIMNIVLLVAGIFYLVATFKPDIEFINKFKFIFLLVGIIGCLAMNIMFIVLWDAPFFAISSGVYVGLGAGFFIGIGALVLSCLHKRMEE